MTPNVPLLGYDRTDCPTISFAMFAFHRVVSFHLGSAPFAEDVFDLGEDTPHHERAAAVRYRAGLLRLYRPLILPLGNAVTLDVVAVDHDLGPHYEVVARVAVSSSAAVELAEYLSNHLPGTWSELEESEPLQRLP